MCKADINKSIGNMMYIGWNKLSSEFYFFLRSIELELEDNDISYRITSIGENLKDVQEDYYTASTDENINIEIPFPSVIRTFDDMDFEQQMTGYMKYLEEKQNENCEEIDYE